MHYYQFNIGDYLKKTRHLSPMEDLAYRRMLDLFYDTELPIPCEIPRIARLIVLSEFQVEIRTVLNEFWVETDAGWTDNRAIKELDSYKSKADSARSNGQKGGRPKGKIKPRKTQSVNSANPELTQTKAKQETLNTNYKPLNNNNIKETPSKLDFSVLQMTDIQCTDVVRIRRKNKGTALTQLIIDQLAKQFFLASEKGFSFQDSLIEWEVRGWKSFKAEWMKSEAKTGQFSQTTMQNIETFRNVELD